MVIDIMTIMVTMLMADIFLKDRNNYHKPIFNLTFDYQIDDISSLSAVFYGSYGREVVEQETEVTAHSHRGRFVLTLQP